MMLRPAALFLLLACSGGAAYAQDVKVAGIVSGDEIALGDGRVVRLAGIKSVSPEAKTFLETNVAGHQAALRDEAPDRYGRIAAAVYIDGQTDSLQENLLKNGMAFVYPAMGDDALLDTMLAVEAAARKERRGWWADHPDISAEDAEKLYGSYGFVVGTVVKAERVKNRVYLNFGADWRTDFTIAIAAHDLRAFKKQDSDPLTWQGKKVRVRGWVKRDFGPMITVTDPHQIELLN